jgi:hypothetical protein
MSEETTAEATASAVSGSTSDFMGDGETYKRGAELGFAGIDFYFAGRGGVLGEVSSDVVSSSFVFFSPAHVTAAWDGSRGVISRSAAGLAFTECLSVWALAHHDDSLDWGRLSELAGKIARTATVAAAPLFAAWRNVEVPDDPKTAALHRLNQLRELRMARHGAAVIALGIDPADAVRHRVPQLVGVFGWEGADVPGDVIAALTEAERLTNVATNRDYSVLTDAESAEFVCLCAAAQAAAR